MMLICYFCGTILGFTGDQRIGGRVVAGENLCQSCSIKFRLLKRKQGVALRMAKR